MNVKILVVPHKIIAFRWMLRLHSHQNLKGSVKSDDQIVDILSKGLFKPAFECLVHKLGIIFNLQPITSFLKYILKKPNLQIIAT